MRIGALELLVVFVVALLVIGPDKLPEYARRFGNALREFRRASADATEDIRKSVVEPLEEAQRPLREAIEPLEDLNREVRQDFKSVERDLNSIGKAPSGRDRKNAAGTNAAVQDTGPPPAAEAPQEFISPSSDGEEQNLTGGNT